MNVLVICHGNINRSPLAAVVLRSSCDTFTNIDSAGFVNPDQRAAKKTREAAASLGFDLSVHRSKLVTKDLCKKADIIVYMDTGNLKRIEEALHYWKLTRKLVCLGVFAEPPVTRIPDPNFISKTDPQFIVVIHLIIKASLNLAAHLSNENKSYFSRT